MIELTTSTLAYPAESRAAWRDGPELLEAARVDEDLKNILTTKRKVRPGSRFFGEAFVATKLRHKKAFYGSFQWLTTSRFLGDDPFPPSVTAEFKEKYRRALHDYFGTQLATLQENTKRLVVVSDGTGARGGFQPDDHPLDVPNTTARLMVALTQKDVRLADGPDHHRLQFRRLDRRGGRSHRGVRAGVCGRHKPLRRGAARNASGFVVPQAGVQQIRVGPRREPKH